MVNLYAKDGRGAKFFTHTSDTSPPHLTSSHFHMNIYSLKLSGKSSFSLNIKCIEEKRSILYALLSYSLHLPLYRSLSLGRHCHRLYLFPSLSHHLTMNRRSDVI